MEYPNLYKFYELTRQGSHYALEFASLKSPFDRYYVFSLPIVFLAIYIGGKAHKDMTQKHFDRYVDVALIGMGAILIIRPLL